jgi:hypothetical protein
VLHFVLPLNLAIEHRTKTPTLISLVEILPLSPYDSPRARQFFQIGIQQKKKKETSKTSSRG